MAGKKLSRLDPEPIEPQVKLPSNLMRITEPCIEHLNRYGHGTQYLRQAPRSTTTASVAAARRMLYRTKNPTGK